jgi:hypothetical protein
MDYKGGTYISQITSSSLETACIKWAKSLEISEIDEFGNKSKEKLIEQMKSNSPVLLNGLLNAWCTSAFLQKGTALINIVQTENISDNEQQANNN